MRWFTLIFVAVAVWYLFFRSGSGGTEPSADAGSSSRLDDLIDGITKAEGGDNLSINNPGNLMNSPNYAGVVGVTGGAAPGRSIFSDLGDGYTALTNYLQNLIGSHPDWDMYDLGHYYVDGPNASASSADANNWADNVAAYMGVSPTETLGSDFGG